METHRGNRRSMTPPGLADADLGRAGHPSHDRTSRVPALPSGAYHVVPRHDGGLFWPIWRLSSGDVRMRLGLRPGGSGLSGGDPGGEEQCDQHEERQGRERGAKPVQASLLVLIQDSLDDLLTRARLGQRRLEVGVGQERDPAVWIPVTVVPTSLATVAMATFITELSSVIRNWPEPSVIRTRPAPCPAALSAPRSVIGES